MSKEERERKRMMRTRTRKIVRIIVRTRKRKRKREKEIERKRGREKDLVICSNEVWLRNVAGKMMDCLAVKNLFYKYLNVYVLVHPMNLRKLI